MYNISLLLSSAVAETVEKTALDLFLEGLVTTVIGMGIVFILLGALSCVLYLLKFVGNDNKKKEEKPAEKPVEVKTTVPVIETVQQTDDLELVAVITAAVAATMGTTSDKFVVKSIKRVDNWNRTSRREQQRTF